LCCVHGIKRAAVFGDNDLQTTCFSIQIIMKYAFRKITQQNQPKMAGKAKHKFWDLAKNIKN
jgi:hypothetical protein